ncbi:MAG TPA: NAD(P)H-binding protein [Sphingomicrobium sp.]|nr:NAD(P)H-binding protein [Sphingomicrobium sp.]
MKLAVTGGTGFVGSHFIEAALAAGHEIRALTRRPQQPRPSLAWVTGSLEDVGSLARLAEGAEAVVHIAGVINARDAAGFETGNVTGTANVLRAADRRRLVHVSSLAAREPQLSQYGASKAKAETLVGESRADWAIVRPPAVYGPGDRETLELFKMAKLRLMLLPPAGRVSMIHAADLSRLLLALSAGKQPSGVTYEADDGRKRGWSHKELARALGNAVGRKNLALSVPAGMLRFGAVVDQLVRREKAKLSADRAAYFSHSDWVCREELRPPAGLWEPDIPTEQGLAETARWYERKGWL